MDENKRGRNLAVMSFAVILYILGGATFNNEGTLFGGSVIFSRVWVLEYASVVLLGFYWYRFYLVTPFFDNVLRHKDDYMRSSAGLRRHIEHSGHAMMNDCANNQKLLGGKKFSNEGVPWPKILLWNNRPSPLTRGIFKRRGMVSGMDNNSNNLVTFEVNLSWWNCLPYELFATLQAIFRGEEFWEDIFPMILALVAFVLVSANKFNLIC